MQRNGAGTLALYAAAAAGGGSAQWILDAASGLAGYEPRPRRPVVPEGAWELEPHNDRGDERKRWLEPEEESWGQHAPAAVGFALPLVWQLVREVYSWACGRARAERGRAEQLGQLDRLAREVLAAGEGTAAVLAAERGVRHPELVAWAESWTMAAQGPAVFARLARPEIAGRQ